MILELKMFYLKLIHILFLYRQSTMCFRVLHYKKTVTYEAVDLLISASSTDISIPSFCAYLIKNRPFKEMITRMSLGGFVCAGGPIGLGCVVKWLQLHETKTALIGCAERCSFAFQQDGE